MIKKLLLFMAVATSVGLGILSVKAGKAQAMFHTQWGEWKDTSECVASHCGTSEGTKNQSRTCEKGGDGFECSIGHWECDKSCPTVTWQTEESECPGPDEAYISTDNKKPCSRKWNVPGDRNPDKVWRYADKVVTQTFGPITFTYDKSQDPNKCHRPTASSQGVPTWAVNDYNHDNPEWRKVEDSNCRMVGTDTETRVTACNDAPVVTCEDEPTDLCHNLVGDQESLPNGMQEADGYCSCKDGYHRVDIEALEVKAMSRIIEQQNFSCEPDSTDPTPEPTPTPTPGPSKLTKDFYSEPWCDGHIALHLTYQDDKVGFFDKPVIFKYNNESKEVKTNKEGKARVDFNYTGESEAKVYFDGMEMTTTVKAAENCPATTGQVLGATTGKVLGASTLAGTGVSADMLMNLVGLSGMAMTAIGYRKYGKKN